MNVNATILVQFGNFILVYIVLRTQLFRPAVEIIEAEKNNRVKIKDAIDSAHLLIEQTSKQDMQQWHTFHTFYSNAQDSMHYPECIFSKISPSVDYPTVSDDMVQQLIDRTTVQLIATLGEK